MNSDSNSRARQPYRICSRCVMDTSDEGIVFDHDGVCSNCSGYLSRTQSRRYVAGDSERMWESYVDVIKKNGIGSQYDCIAGVSGGVDSSYAVYLCRKYNLRTLLVHLDNGWDSQVSVENIRILASSLGFDYTSVVIDWEEFREIQIGFLRAFTVDFEMPTDIAIHAAILQTARKHGVRYIVSGGNLTSEGMLPLTWGYHRYKDMHLYRSIVRRYSSRPLRKVPVIGLAEEAYYRFLFGMKTLYILNYHDYNKDHAKEFLQKELGWRDYGGKHHESRITAFWHGYVMYEKFGKDYRRPTLSAQICNEQITRAEALELLKLPSYNPERVIEEKVYIAKKFKMELSDFELLLQSPPKCYLDFPNRKKLIDFCYGLYNKYFNARRV